MIKSVFPTYFVESTDILDKDSLSKIYNFVIINHDVIVTPEELPELGVLKKTISEKALELANAYNFSSVEVSNRFSTHFYPAKETSLMEMHSDDLGDYGRKFIAFFYLEADNNSEKNGELEFHDPRWLNSPWKNASNPIKIAPKTNKLVIFPTFLWHKVNDYFSEVVPRMAIDVVVRVI